MIYFNHLEAEGGFSFSKVDVPLGNQGLALITGRNLDDFEGSTGSAPSGASANGAGKSSLLEIITHNIFANTGKGVRKNGIVNDSYEDGYMSRLSLDIGLDKFTYLQTRNHKKFGTVNTLCQYDPAKDLFVDAQIKGLEETQKAFMGKVRLSLDDWYATVYAPQETKHLFTRTDSNDLKKDMLARIFNLNYKAFLEDTKKRLEETRTSLVKLKSSVASTKAQLISQLAALPYHSEVDFQNQISKISREFENLKILVDTKIGLLTKFQEAKVNKATKQNYEVQIQDQLIQISAWSGSIPTSQDIQNLISTTQDSIKQINQHIKDITAYILVLQQRDQATADFSGWPSTNEYESLNKLDELELELQSIQTSSSNLQTTYSDTFFKTLDSLKTLDFKELKTLKEDIDKLTEESKTLNVEVQGAEIHHKTALANWEKVQSGTCYACERPFPQEKIEIVKKEHEDWKAKYESCSAKALVLKTNLEKKVQDYGTLQFKFNEYENLRIRLLDPSHLEWTLQEYQNQKQLLEQSYKLKKTFIDSIRLCKIAYEKWKSFESITGDLSVYERSLEDLNKSHTNFSNYLLALSTIQSLIFQYEKIEILEIPEIDELQVGAEIRKANEDKDKVGADLSVLGRDFELFQDYTKQMNKILENERIIDELEKNEQIYNSLSYVFGPKGLVVSRLDVICKYLTEKVNYYISRILKENVQMQFVMDEDSLDLNIRWNGKIRPVQNISGGENGKVGLACMLGLRSLLPVSYQTNILILDEAEANWDDRVRHELVEMLETLLVSTNIDSIFMISHSPAIQELQMWNTHLHCVKENGISTLEITNR